MPSMKHSALIALVLTLLQPSIGRGSATDGCGADLNTTDVVSHLQTTKTKQPTSIFTRRREGQNCKQACKLPEDSGSTDNWAVKASSQDDCNSYSQSMGCGNCKTPEQVAADPRLANALSKRGGDYITYCKSTNCKFDCCFGDCTCGWCFPM
eukprot:TRINITY_DN25096_c0_g1_i1.p1 TRINITY_DN25096_c0_g1~~TRINITY_DN25096_c0_g1_i1.p1  ORF type:complete len:152 (+),score=19.40 TRINITY_DN25096_c0_g1_i1:39-494(+)